MLFQVVDFFRRISMKKIIIIFVTIICPIMLFGVGSEDYVFFDDSPTETSYDPSWGYVNSPSILERVGEKFPVSSEIYFQGENSLKLHWTSKSGGDWGMAIAEVGWPGHDISVKDTLSFWVYSETEIVSDNLPLIYLEDLSNNKTPKVNLSAFSINVPVSQWIKIKVPIEIFVNNPGSTDLTKIKTIFYGQDLPDDIDHTMYIDEVRMYAGGSADTIPPLAPTGLITEGFYKHVDLAWTPNEEEDLDGYNIYRSEDGSAYIKTASLNDDLTKYTDFIGESDVTVDYKLTAIDKNYNESEYSISSSTSTQDMTDDEILTMVQQATFRYFWDNAHPVSGLARERSPGGKNTVTSGGSGFGIMAVLVGIEREFITREQGSERILLNLNFLKNADRFHGAWSHWLNGETGTAIPFSQYDDGGDLVETAFLVQGILTARQYFNQDNQTENQIRDLATELWESVEWDWYRRTESSNFLYWHWSPNHNWTMNFQLQGPNETMITYLLGIASPTHPIPASMWEDGWASSVNYENGKEFYGYPLWVGWDYGGPLFFSHYSFIGFDPRGIKDSHCNYFLNNKNQTLINRAWCIDNPGEYEGYGENCWGLTASDDPFGYSAHEPTLARDNGTITPTAALSSFPYTPEESMNALKYFYNELGEDLWGIFGFKDAFNLSQNWFAGSYIAIDQGPIIDMIENYRSGLLWNNFMANPEIQPVLDAIGFVTDTTTAIESDEDVFESSENFRLKGNYPNPFNPKTTIQFFLSSPQKIKLEIYNLCGREIFETKMSSSKIGVNRIDWNGKNLNGDSVSGGVYFYKIITEEQFDVGKMLLLK